MNWSKVRGVLSSPKWALGARAVGRWAWRHRKLVLLGLVLLLVLLAVRNCRRVGELEDATSAGEERQRARAEGATPVEPVPDVDPRLREVLAQNAELEALVVRLQKKLGARPVAVLHASTEPTPVARLVPAGERLRLEVASVELLGRAGSRMAVGTVAAFGEDGALLLRAPWSAAVSDAEEEATPAPRRPGRLALGPLVGLSSTGGAVYGAAGTFRLFEVWGWGIEVLGTGAAGPGGTTFQAALLVRR